MSKVDSLYYSCTCCGIVEVGSERNKTCKYKTMSKVEAYKCDHCNQIVEENGIVGVDRIEDLHDKERSFPTIPNPAKSYVHYCVDCYRTHVLIPAANLSDRKRDEREYELKVKELAYGLRRTTVFKYNERQRFKQGKKKT